MYQSFTVKNFRCFRHLELKDLERINLIAGRNNVGKTALLEALFVHCGAYNPELTVRINILRGIDKVKYELGPWGETPWDLLFEGFDASGEIELSGEFAQRTARRLKLRLHRGGHEASKKPLSVQHISDYSYSISSSLNSIKTLELEFEEGEQRGCHHMVFDPNFPGLRIEPMVPPPPFPAIFLAARSRIPPLEDAERLGKLELMGKEAVVLRAMQCVEPRLRRLVVVTTGGVPIIHGDVGLNRLVPLPLMGEGMARLASLVLAIGNVPHGVLLVDEIENGMHHSVLSKVWQVIAETAEEFDAQIFATTHSLECIHAAHTSLGELDKYAFRLHRLERIGESVRVVTYDRESLDAAIEAELEVR